MAKQSSTRTSLATRLNGLQTESKPDATSGAHLAEYKALRYDYGKVKAAHRRTVQDAAVDIRRKQKRTIEDLLAIGRRLLEVKDFLPFGEFGIWIEEEFELSERMVQGTMNAARVYLDEAKARRVALLSERAIYMLSAPSTPAEARTEVEQLVAGTGKALSSGEVERIIKAHKAVLSAPAPPPAPRMIEMQAATPAVAAPLPAPLPEPTMPADLDERDKMQAAATWTEAVQAADDAAHIEADYTVISTSSFDVWLAAMPTNLTLAECATFFELAKTTAKRALDIHQIERPGEPTQALYNAVYGALPTWSNLIRAFEKAAK